MFERSREMSYPSDFKAQRRETADSGEGIEFDGSNSIPPGFGNRLKAAVKAAGGHGRVSEGSGIASRTLSYLLKGQEPKLSQLLAIAKTCDVRLEWLATGRGPMREGEGPAGPQLPASLQDLDYDTLLAGLHIAEALTPDATVEARVSATLVASASIRRQHRLGAPLAIEEKTLAACLRLVEGLVGRNRPADRRLRSALGAYLIMIHDLAEPEPYGDAADDREVDEATSSPRLRGNP